MSLPPLSLLETRVLGVLVEKQLTVPDTYPLTLNALVAGCNQKTSRDPVIEASEDEVQAAIDHLKALSLVVESSGGRVMRYAQNVARVLAIPVAGGRAARPSSCCAARRPSASCASTASACTASATSRRSEGFLHELAARPRGALVRGAAAAGRRARDALGAPAVGRARRGVHGRRCGARARSAWRSASSPRFAPPSRTCASQLAPVRADVDRLLTELGISRVERQAQRLRRV